VSAAVDLFNTGPSRAGVHRLEDWECPQRWSYRHNLKLSPLVVPLPLAVGTLFHLGRAVVAAARMGDPQALGLDPVEVMKAAHSRVALGFEDARKLFLAWTEYSKHQRDHVLAVEREFAANVGGFLHTQRMDQVIEVRGRACTGDTKSTSGEASRAHIEWEMHLQMLSAELLGRALYPRPAPEGFGLEYGGLFVDVASKRDLSFRRTWITVNPELLAQAREQIARINREIQAAKNAKLDPWEYPRNYFQCTGRWGACKYKALCTSGKSALDQYIAAEDEVSALEG